MSSHIEWAHARHLAVAGVAYPGEFSNGDEENDVACVVISDGNGDGICIQGPPDDLIALAKRITVAAFDVAQATAGDPELRALYGMVSQ